MSKKLTYDQKVVWIIGASSGIGAALAYELASRGAMLALSARRRAQLEQVKNSLPGNGHDIFPLDVRSSAEVLQAIGDIRLKMQKIHSIIFLAAEYTPMKFSSLDLTVVQQIINTNLVGSFNVVQAALPILQQQSGGQIALCASIAGYYGLPGGQPYSATKAGIINLAESLRAELPSMIDIKLINPGFVRTPLTAKNSFKMPIILEASQAAILIADGLLTKQFEIHFPKLLSYFLKILQFLPYKLSLKITKLIHG